MYCLQECEHIMGVTHNFESMVCAVVYTVLRFESVEHILLQHFPAYFWGCNTLTHCVYFPHMWNILLKPLTTHNCLLMREAHVWCKRPRTWISLGVVPSSTLWVHQDHLHHQALVRMNWKKKMWRTWQFVSGIGLNSFMGPREGFSLPPQLSQDMTCRERDTVCMSVWGEPMRLPWLGTPGWRVVLGSVTPVYTGDPLVILHWHIRCVGSWHEQSLVHQWNDGEWYKNNRRACVGRRYLLMQATEPKSLGGRQTCEAMLSHWHMAVGTFRPLYMALLLLHVCLCMCPRVLYVVWKQVTICQMRREIIFIQSPL